MMEQQPSLISYVCTVIQECHCSYKEPCGEGQLVSTLVKQTQLTHILYAHTSPCVACLRLSPI